MIRALFDPARDIDRTIEKVITYGADQAQRLRAEIAEYVVTDSIEDQLRRLLDKMQLAMDGGADEVGVWVSGFYGSGKSSFTKYLGMALDPNIAVDGVPFLKLLADRLHSAPARAQLNTLAQRFPAAVVMVDLASEMVAGATLESVSTVLFYKVLQWAGYSRNPKVAALEERIERDGRVLELHERALALADVPWSDWQNDPLVVDVLIPQIAHEMYPKLFPQPDSFRTHDDGAKWLETERVQKMLDLVRMRSGRQHVIFIVDEVGQYVAAKDELVLGLDGLAKNLKAIGQGAAWLIATAQQTLTEDDPNVKYNTANLFKLKDRFPIHVHLESSDIREICYRRLLGKSAAGEAQLGALFDAHGQQLIHATRLQNARAYGDAPTRDDFLRLYPFLPAHFDILLHLLGVLAKSTGGYGLRSAIKIVQDVLRGEDGSRGIANQPVGRLVTTATLFDELHRDIARVQPQLARAVEDVGREFPGAKLHVDIAKSVAVLQMLGNLPASVDNIAALLHPSVDAPPQTTAVRAAVDELLANRHVPLEEQDGALVFLSERLRDIADERDRIVVRPVDLRRIVNEALRVVFEPRPRATLHGNLVVEAGLKVQQGGGLQSLSGEQNPIQLHLELTPAADHAAARARMLDDSRQRSHAAVIGLVAAAAPEIDDIAAEIVRCERIVDLHRADADREVKEYCRLQQEYAEKRRAALQHTLRHSLQGGSFLFAGQTTAVSALSTELGEAARKCLADAAARVFERYAEAPVRVDTDAAERILKASGPAAIVGKLDPLGLVRSSAGKISFDADHKAVRSLKDFLDRKGSVDGKSLLDAFAAPPFGWSQDTTRYVLAVLLTAGEISLRYGGRDVIAAGPAAAEALKTNKSFAAAQVHLRNDKPTLDVLLRAAERLGELFGQDAPPIEQEIARAAAAHLTALQPRIAQLTEKMAALQVPGIERAQRLTAEVTALVGLDAGDAARRLGAPDSPLYADLRWAIALARALDGDLAQTLKDLRLARDEIAGLPNVGPPADLKRDAGELLQQAFDRLASPNFFEHVADFRSLRTQVQAMVDQTAARMREQLAADVRLSYESIAGMAQWPLLSGDVHRAVEDAVLQLKLPEVTGLAGLRAVVNQQFALNNVAAEQRRYVEQKAHEARAARSESLTGGTPIGAESPAEVHLPARVHTLVELDAVIARLSALRTTLGEGGVVLRVE